MNTFLEIYMYQAEFQLSFADIEVFRTGYDFILKIKIKTFHKPHFTVASYY